MAKTEPQTEPIDKLECYVRKGELDLIATLDVDAWLADRLEANETLQTEFDMWREDNEKADCYQSALEFAAAVKGGKGIYGDGEPFVTNTCNGECLLSEVLQFVYWTDDDGSHVLLERHLGGDQRGNYAPIEAFDCTDSDGTAIFDNTRGTIFCNDCNSFWDTDDDVHWCSDDDSPDLQDYPAVDELPDYPELPNHLQGTLPIDLPPRPKQTSGVVWVDDDGRPHCPYCGGVLELCMMYSG